MSGIVHLVLLGSVLAMAGATQMSERECVFPFEYKGVSYTRCTNTDMRDPSKFWCSLDRVYRGYVAFCKDSWKFELLDALESLRRNQTLQARRLDRLSNVTGAEEHDIAELERWARRSQADVRGLLRGAAVLAADMSRLHARVTAEMAAWNRRLADVAALVSNGSRDAAAEREEGTAAFRRKYLETLQGATDSLLRLANETLPRLSSVEERVRGLDARVGELESRGVQRCEEPTTERTTTERTTTATAAPNPLRDRLRTPVLDDSDLDTPPSPAQRT